MDDRASVSPTGRPPLHHWQMGMVSQPGLEGRGDVFFAAVAMTRMPMVVTDPNQPDNPIVFANGAFFDLTGYEKDEVLGRNCRFLQGAQTDRETVAEIREAVRNRRPISLEVLNYKRDGSAFWNALFIGPVFDPQGKLLYFFASQMDITRRRVSEQAFYQAQKMEAIGQLTAGLAHDFNNLLQVIAGTLEQMTDLLDTNPAAIRRPLELAERATQQGARLTQQLLTFARKQRLDPKPVRLNALVTEFVDMLSRTVGDRVSLRLDLRAPLPPCQLDPVHLEMALLNVVINARDAMPDGGEVVIATGLTQLDGEAESDHLPPGEYVTLSVSDRGDGMPPDVLRRAAEPFFTTKGPGRGTGLGLAMVHGFVQQSRGRLEIESTPGQGTTLRMLFPRAAARPAEQQAPVPRQPSAASEGTPATVLVVDDSDDVRELAVSHLTGLGYRVLSARSGEEALALLDHGPPIDLLFTDLVMPGGINGLVLAERFRRRSPDTAVLLTTGYNEELNDDSPHLPEGAVLGKPYRRAELADRVGDALAGRGTGGRTGRDGGQAGPADGLHLRNTGT
ncbi:hybrid sensor histidine kinase/response regulator [Azospirillum thermophilum]|uniref:histidine kinase n=2 Tax=Azospirillum thermophilum TaxID=2202148 RepID=A0A2S2CU07_9PROT|nr:hybrid sensor histidine kinase/response regulator [Azospirillum thermophilum]